MKDFYNLFEYELEHRPIIEEFINIYNSPEYKTISKKVKTSYKKDLCKWLYCFKVYQTTEANAPMVKDINKRGKEFHLDHVIPVLYGYKYGIDSDIIGSLPNLQMLSLNDNFSKGSFIVKPVRDMFSFFNIKYLDLQLIKHPRIAFKPKQKELPPLEVITQIEVGQGSFTAFPDGGDW